jgi:hypothetical protein
MTGDNDFMDHLEEVIVDYEAIAAGLEAGHDKVHRTSRSGEKEDISLKLQTTTGVLLPTSKRSWHVMERRRNKRWARIIVVVSAEN